MKHQMVTNTKHTNNNFDSMKLRLVKGTGEGQRTETYQGLDLNLGQPHSKVQVFPLPAPQLLLG